MSDYTLYGSPISLFTGKARSYLRYKNIPFQEKLSSINVYKKIIIPKTGVRFIPVVKTPDDQYIQDTTIIIDELEQKFPERSVFPTTPKQLLVAKLFEWYGDDWLVIPAMHYRWNKNQEDYIYSNFGQSALPNWPRFVQKFFGKKVGAKFRGFVPMLGITEQTIPAIEAWYEEDFLPQLDQHFAQHNYLLGNRASIGDFGLMGPLYAHLYLDPAPGKIMTEQAPNVVKWIERMNSTPETIGEWYDNDEISDTLLPILTRLFKEFTPVMENTVNRLAEWKEQHPDKHIPRVIGNQPITIGAATGEFIIRPFSQWKMQRVLSELPNDEAQRNELKSWLSAFSGQHLLDINITSPVTRANNQLVWQ